MSGPFWAAKDQNGCGGPKNGDSTLNVAAGKNNSSHWQEYA
ncbi:hypothetical protein [Streptomyces kebangsaanensis]|nr:hypothetical protein [Streptomyces kebangsaanensis]